MEMSNRFVLDLQRAQAAGPHFFGPIKKLISEMIVNGIMISQPPIIAIGVGSSGRTFIGVNVDLPGLPLHYSIHAEQFLVTNLILNSERKLETLAIFANGSHFQAPCSRCCQFLIQGIPNFREIRVLITDSNGQNETSMPLVSFLPQTSNPYNAVPSNVPDLLQPRNNDLTFIDRDSARELCGFPKYCHHFKCQALAAANRSYAPQTNLPSGVALMNLNRDVFSGCYIESVGNNSSLGPVQAALVHLVACGRRNFGAIVKAVLVKRPSDLRQEESARMIIQTIAHPNCVFSVLNCW